MRLTAATAARFARLAFDCVHREYPNKIAHVLSSDADVRPPRELTPAFYGCFDWHSAVHGHWMLARLARLFPEEPFAQHAVARLRRSITPVNVDAEVRYLVGPNRDSFERPYGLAWLLALHAELQQSAPELAAILAPLEDAAFRKMSAWIQKLPYPDRCGQHANTAFALGLILDAKGNSGDIFRERALHFYGNDANGPLRMEPSGEDFLSPCLAEADLMRRVLEPSLFADWLSGFLPDISMLQPAVSPDRADGKLAHLDGLNLSRAWMLRGVAKGLPDRDARKDLCSNLAEKHREAGLASVTGEHYEGGHWLGTFAVYLETS
ncbi:MAG: DUF2891 domain-containing protein [Bryobacteraceae bacterium]